MNNYLTKRNIFTYWTFVYLGLINLVCWNIILTSLDTYDLKYYTYNPIFVFPIMNVILCSLSFN